MARVTLVGLEGQIKEEILPLLKEHDKILIRGNGEPSLQEKLRNIETYIKEDRQLREEKAKEDKENRNFYLRLFVSVAVTNFVALGIAAFMWFAKIYPLLMQLEKMQKVSF